MKYSRMKEVVKELDNLYKQNWEIERIQREPLHGVTLHSWTYKGITFGKIGNDGESLWKVAAVLHERIAIALNAQYKANKDRINILESEI